MASENLPQEKAVQISKLIGTSMVLDLEPLKEILCNADVSDKKIVVYAMTGEKKSGKSFLLNYMLRYLKAEGAPDWFGAEDEPLVGFDWGGGPKKSTKGIWAWNKLLPIRQSRKKEIYVMLIDTEVRYGNRKNVKPFQSIDEFSETDSQIVKAFDLGVLLSSVHLHSMLRNVNLDFMKRKLFDTTNPSRTLRPNERSRQNIILIRDWEHPDDYPFGLRGGLEYMNQRFPANQISEFYRKDSTYLLPHIGPDADGVVTFDGNNADLGEEFTKKYKTFIEKWFSGSMLDQKTIVDFQLTCSDLYKYCEEINSVIMRIAGERSLSILEADMFCYSTHEREKTIDYYESVMAERLTQELHKLTHIQDLHEDLLSDALLELEKLGMPDEVYRSQSSQLKVELHFRFISIKESARYVKAKYYEDHLNNLIEEYKTQLESRLTPDLNNLKDLDITHQELKTNAIEELKKLQMPVEKNKIRLSRLVNQMDYLYVPKRARARHDISKHVVNRASEIFKNLRTQTGPVRLRFAVTKRYIDHDSR